MRSAVYFLPLILWSCTPQPDTSSEKAAIYQSYIDVLVERGQFNGNVLVAEKGEVVFKTSVGLSSVDGDSLDLDSQFRLASVSKQFTCMAIMQLKEKGLLDYDDSVQKHVPEWPYPGTIRQLMNHTSGVPDYVTLFYEQWKPELADDDLQRTMHGNEHMVSFIVEHQPEPYFEPGERYQYSNTAYVLLATIVSRVSGEPFEEYMRENVYLPAGMHDTYVFSPLRDDPLENRVYGFKEAWDGSVLEPLDYNFLNAVAGDGGTYSTLDDLFAWNKALYTDAVASQATIQEAFEPAILNSGDTSWYGFGWGIQAEGKWGSRVSHGGSWVGFRTYIDRLLDDRSCIIVLTNHSSPYLQGVVRGLRDIVVGSEYTLPKISAALEVMKVILTEGPEQAPAALAKFKAQADTYEIIEWQFNSMGYELLNDGDAEAAVAMFAINTEEFPDSANAWDSLGEGLLARDDKEGAIASFKKALELDPDRSGTRAKLTELEVD